MDEGYDRRKLVALGVGLLVVVLVIVFFAVRHSAASGSAGPSVVTATRTVNPTDQATDSATTSPSPAPTQGSSVVSTRTYLPTVSPTAGWKQTETFSVPPSYTGPALNLASAQEVARRFAVPFSTYAIGSSQSTWTSSLTATGSTALIKTLPVRFDEFWYYLTSSSAGAEDARVTKVQGLGQRSGRVLYRVTVERRISAPSNPGMNGAESVQWDLLVAAQPTGGPRVIEVQKAAPGPLPSP